MRLDAKEAEKNGYPVPQKMKKRFAFKQADCEKWNQYNKGAW